MSTSSLSSIEFKLPPELEASEPPEARGLKRDQVRLMVSNYSTDEVRHTRFDQLSDYLSARDVLVINTSRTRNSALLATRESGAVIELHVSTHLDDVQWTVEARSINETGKTKHLEDAHPGEILSLPGGVLATLQMPYVSDCNDNSTPSETLWLAKIDFPEEVDEYLERYGFPIRYNYIKEKWVLDYYQTVYATENGSAEMPSAGRPFTPELLSQLTAKGIQIAPLILHTGVSNLETHDPPYKEFYRVTPETAEVVNEARASRHHIVAVGTTAIRALETVTNGYSETHAGEGWTCLVVTPQRKLRSVDSLITGMHEPEASHLAILESLAGLPHIKLAYEQALRNSYLWHEFGDLHLIMP